MTLLGPWRKPQVASEPGTFLVSQSSAESASEAWCVPSWGEGAPGMKPQQSVITIDIPSTSRMRSPGSKAFTASGCPS